MKLTVGMAAGKREYGQDCITALYHAFYFHEC